MQNIRLLFSIKIFFITIFFSGNLNCQTVEPNMSFDNLTYDFGTIKESAGNAEHQFTFTNMGAETIVITNVTSSCGCTTPAWSKEPVKPGEKGYIKAVYNPYNRPGAFHKTITVTSNATNSPLTLNIKGEVIPKEKDIADEYRYEFGPIRMKKNNVHFSEIYNTEIKEDIIEIFNPTKESITIGIDEKRQLPAHINFVCNPETLAPNEKALITFTYDASKKNDWGYVYDRIYISFNGNSDPNQRINVSAVIKEKPSPELIKNPPIFTITGDKTFDFGTIKQGETIEHIFKFKNTGKNDLIIRKTKASCGCTAVQLGDKIIKPGEESSIKAIFNSSGKSGNQHKSITITTNIPDIEGQEKQSDIILMMKGIVETPNSNK
jgi:hypothetical protein